MVWNNLCTQVFSLGRYECGNMAEEELMKVLAFTMGLLVICALAIADIAPFEQLGSGLFAGKYASYASGDTIAVVYYYIAEGTPNPVGMLAFKYSNNAGQDWTTHTRPMIGEGITIPRLIRDGDNFVVSYTHNYQRFIATYDISTQEWTCQAAGRTFEISPQVYTDNGVYKLYSLDLPYPQWRMDEFVSESYMSGYKIPQGITDKERSMNDTPLYFMGMDVIYGPYRTNGDLYIKQAGGGTNNGWPTFTDLVICGGSVVSASGNYPLEQIFQGGLIENAPLIEMPDNYTMQNGVFVGPASYNPSYIVRVEVTGMNYQAWLGTKTVHQDIQYDVYPVYPIDPLGEPLYTNTVARVDTVWTALAGGTCAGRNLFTPNELWIKGDFSGRQTWASGSNIYIIGDITLTHTIPGNSPTSPLNTVDKVNLISEKSVLIKYGYKDHLSSERVHLARADSNPIKIYANIYALADNQANPRNSGVFSFEYQHPHPSVPAVMLGDTLWDKIDLHRRKFPQTVDQPWPANIDYPWYNPLWPEAHPYLERGTIQLWGSTVQVNKGFIHRALYDTEWPSNGIWDIAMDYCGGTSAVNYNDPVLGINLSTVNYPGATGSGIGYKKDFRYDPRQGFDGSGLRWHLGPEIYSLSTSPEGDLEESLIAGKSYVQGIWCDQQFAQGNGLALFSMNNRLFKISGDQIEEFGTEDGYGGNIMGIALNSYNMALIAKSLEQTGEGGDETFRLSLLNANTGEYTEPWGFSDLASRLYNVAVLPNDRWIFAYMDSQMQIKVWEMLPDYQTVLVDSWDLSTLPLGTNLMNSRLALVPVPDSYNQLDVYLWISNEGQYGEYPNGQIWYARSIIPIVASDDPVAPALKPMAINAYPNPSKGELKIELMGTDQDARVEIFNLRGQRLMRIQDGTLSESGALVYDWDGKDASGNKLGSGIYLIRVWSKGRPAISKRICIF